MKKNVWLPWYLLMLLSACALRAGLWFVYSPKHTSDLQGYLDVTQMILRMDFSHNGGARPPAYPLLLALSGPNEYVTWIYQMGLGLLISTMLFLFSWKLIRSAPWAFFIALLYSLNVAQLFFEATMLAETLSTFLLLLTLGLAARVRPSVRKNGWYTVGLGTVIGLAVLTRPMYIYFSPLFLAYLYWQWRGEILRRRIFILAACLLPTLILVLGWSAVNWATTGYFGPTTLTGYYLMNHTGNFVEYAPEEYAVVRDIYLKHRAEQIATTGNQAMTVWRSFNDMTNATGLSYAGLSQLLTKMSITLIVEHPLLYLQSAADSWLIFWKVSNFWDPELIKPAWLVPPLNAIWWAERYALVAINILFILMGLGWFYRWIRRRITPEETPLFLIWILVMTGSFFQALLERGDNARYAVSFEVVILWVFLLGAIQLRRMIPRRNPSAEGEEKKPGIG
jgi:4-amino-4-deoxy-L-arabinose transferase-like glycosyltransferase